MTARLVPRPKTGDSPLTIPSVESRQSSEPKVLAYAVDDKIYVLLDAPSGSGSVRIAERPDTVWALTVHKGELVDGGGDGRILYTGTDELIQQRPDTVWDLAVLGGRLVDASGAQIRYTETGRLIRRRPQLVDALAVYNGELVDAGAYGNIFYTNIDELINQALGPVHALTVYNDKLVDADDYGQINRTETGRLIRQRPGWVNALIVYSGRLVDASGKKVRYTETDETILTAEGIVTALCLIPLSLAERLVRGKGPE